MIVNHGAGIAQKMPALPWFVAVIPAGTETVKFCDAAGKLSVGTNMLRIISPSNERGMSTIG
jgi:hypothetical protein